MILDAPYRVDAADNLDWLRSLPTGCANLCVTSPPYEDARTYGIGFKARGQAWVDWCVLRVAEMCRVVNGIVFFNAAGKVRQFQYSPVVEWLVADLTRNRGIVCGPAPYAFHRVGIPGSGGPHYHRRDWEPVYCFARPECLPPAWSDNTAMGHPPKWAPGGEMSHRLSDGKRRNQWGGASVSPHERNASGERQSSGRPSHVVASNREAARRAGVKMEVSSSSNDAEGNPITQATYLAPAIANPGNVVKCSVGGGQMGSPLAHESEAPFPESLVEFFVRSYAPEGGIVIDPHCGSGTTGAVAVRWGRRFLGCDIRESQCEVARRRIAGEVGLFSDSK